MFDWFIFVDYSGSLRSSEQRKRIALSIKKERDHGSQTTLGWTRGELQSEVERLLSVATESGKRVIFGFDHNYSFPVGFYEAFTGKTWNEWREMLTLLAEGGHGMPALDPENPRSWASKSNDRLMHTFGVPVKGPFWGPHFDPLKKPEFPFGCHLKERRLVEERCPRMKSIFQLGGAGAVGLQSLLGMVHLHRLLKLSKEQGVSLHSWPFDGFEIPDGSHVLVEMYPTLFNRRSRSDINDAQGCVEWLSEEVRKGRLEKWFSPEISELEKDSVRLEGWALGI